MNVRLSAQTIIDLNTNALNSRAGPTKECHGSQANTTFQAFSNSIKGKYGVPDFTFLSKFLPNYISLKVIMSIVQE